MFEIATSKVKTYRSAKSLNHNFGHSDQNLNLHLLSENLFIKKNLWYLTGRSGYVNTCNADIKGNI